MDDQTGRTVGGSTLPMLDLKEDGTFGYRTNLYTAMFTITGIYRLENKEVILEFKPYQYRGFIGDSDTSYRFKIISNTVLQLISKSAGMAVYGDVFIRE